MKFRAWKFGKRWFFHLKAKNGEIVLQSEGCKNKQDALDTIALIKQGAFNAKVEVLKKPPVIKA